MKKTINGKTFNTDTSIELGVTGRMVDVSNGIKTFVLERMYETRKGDEWFLVTTITRFKTNNEYDFLSSNDNLISSEKTFQTITDEEFREWMDKKVTTYCLFKKF